ncbi:laccase-7-like [Abrus precatorius]|uniref:Laccase n=1 Tax=Abrus precatorius TaxID=3816 RepID=A0A8B8L8J5_ABRPR|nr:laccase-7-like [Abrus precatorius]
MRNLVFALAWVFALLASSSMTSAAIVEHTFNVANFTIPRLCNNQVITAVNGEFPGPTLHVREGDTVVIHVLNNSPYNVTIHWHGIFQILSGWADGPEYVTQCPIRPKHNFTYRFKIQGQEGTLWWHAHASFLRATVHGAIFIHPRKNHPYAFPKPYEHVPILFGEWWKSNIMDFDAQRLPPSDAFMINGLPGDLYNCSKDQMFNLKVKPGKTYLLRIINANINSQMFFKVANHNFTVVAIDAVYTTPYATDLIVIAPGQTTDALLKADQPIGSYYMAASIYFSTTANIDRTTTRGLIVYEGSKTTTPLTPILPAFNDSGTANKFFTNLTGLVNRPHWRQCPHEVDEHMFITLGINLAPCPINGTCVGPQGFQLSASMNNESFVLPSDKKMSMLEAFYYDASGVYTKDFPSNPPLEFDYTNPNNSLDFAHIFAPKSTKVKKLKYNSTVEIVYQNVAFLDTENHPMHIHGFNFFVLAQGLGNYNATQDRMKFNLVNPQMRNTVAVEKGGWAVIRFKADNPGIWLVHCHVDSHLEWGMTMAFEIENGPTPSSRLPSPPHDLPKC